MACGDTGPQGYSVADLKALPESKLIVPDGEVVRTEGTKGGTLPSYQNTSYVIAVRTNLGADAVFDFYAAKLGEGGWVFSEAANQSSTLLEARGHKEDFDIYLRVRNPNDASSAEDWGGRNTLYELTIVAARDKSK
jgi:hypothetical protein